MPVPSSKFTLAALLLIVGNHQYMLAIIDPQAHTETDTHIKSSYTSTNHLQPDDAQTKSTNKPTYQLLPNTQQKSDKSIQTSAINPVSDKHSKENQPTKFSDNSMDNFYNYLKDSHMKEEINKYELDENLRKLARQVCGSHWLCQDVTRDLQFHHIDQQSCCQSCSCDHTCWLTQNCCPDVKQTVATNIKPGTGNKATSKTENYGIFTTPIIPTDISDSDTDQQESNEHETKISNSVEKAINAESETPTRQNTMFRNQDQTKTLLPSSQNLAITNRHKNNVYDKQLTNYMTCQTLSDSLPMSQEMLQLNKNKLIDKEKQDHATTLIDCISQHDLVYLVTNSCPQTYPDAETIAKCQGTFDNISGELITDFVPVTDWYTEKLYRNIYCAKCHNITNIIQWNLFTNCPELYLMNKLPKSLKELNKIRTNCFVKAVPTFSIEYKNQICMSDEFSDQTGVIKECNTTGKWQVYDKSIEDKCVGENMIAHYHDVTENKIITYRNLFCYVCNAASMEDHAAKCLQNVNLNQLGLDQLEDSDPEPFHAYIQLFETDTRLVLPNPSDNPNTEAQNTTAQCPYGYIVDVYTDNCIQFVCPIDQMQVLDVCVEKRCTAVGLVLSVTLHFQANPKPIYIGTNFTAANTVPADVIKHLHNQVDKKLLFTAKGCKYISIIALANAKNGYTDEIFMKYKVSSTKKCTVENMITSFKSADVDKIVISGITINQNFTIPEMVLKMNFTELQDKQFNFKNILTNKQAQLEVQLNASFHCPRMVFTFSEYNTIVENGFLEPLDDFFFHTQHYKETGELEICQYDYLRTYLKEMYKKSQESENEKSLGATSQADVSLISTLISMVSTVIVLITYFLFNELRFIPGKLFMILCINLLLAQAFYTFGMNLGEDNIWCKLIGACIHLFWLSNIFSMNTCLWLMLKNFHKPLQADSRVILQSKSNKQIMKFILYCYSMPIFFVLLNVTISGILSDGKLWGYGGELCYITTALMRMITFALPIAVLMFVNFAMFTLIISSIRDSMKSNYQAADAPKQLIIFLKLSTITGMFWCFGFLYEATNIEIFAYLFTILNAGQGFFLMWSFLFNKRVFQLYKALLEKHLKRLWFSEAFSSVSDTPPPTSRGSLQRDTDA